MYVCEVLEKRRQQIKKFLSVGRVQFGSTLASAQVVFILNQREFSSTMSRYMRFHRRDGRYDLHFPLAALLGFQRRH